MKTPSSDLEATIEALRKQKYPDLPEDLVVKILQIEALHVENRMEAYKRVMQAIEEYLAEEDTGC
jgi:hypothetical protein